MRFNRIFIFIILLGLILPKSFEGGGLHVTGGAADGKPEGLHVIYFQSGGIEMTVN
jgi:hypothetical protein